MARMNNGPYLSVAGGAEASGRAMASEGAEAVAWVLASLAARCASRSY